MKKIERHNFYIITGSPGAGKTSVITALQAKGFQCVNEFARQIIKEQIQIGGDALHWKDQIKYLNLMMSRSISDFERVTEKTLPVFFDRAIPELAGYCRLIKTEVPDLLKKAIQLLRYNKKVFIFPPWEEIYHHDSERKLTWQEAVATYHRVIISYETAGYELVEVPKLPIAERVEFILQHVNE